MPISEALLQSCGQPPPAEDNSQGALLRNHVQSMAWAWECAGKHAEIADGVRRFNDQARQQGGRTHEKN